MLSDADILKEMEAGNIICEPFVRENLSNSSIDLRLGSKIKILTVANPILSYGTSIVPPISPYISFECDETGKVQTKYNNCKYEEVDIKHTGYVLKPQEFILAETVEYVGQSCNFIISEVADKSSLARVGLGVCFSAGFIDAGNVLNITLEIVNHNSVPIVLSYEQHICHLKFTYLNTPCIKMYNGKYLNSRRVQEAK